MVHQRCTYINGVQEGGPARLALFRLSRGRSRTRGNRPPARAFESRTVVARAPWSSCFLHGVSMKVSIRYFLDALKYWSERRDLNSGPLAPHASALPGCATLRHRLFFLPRLERAAGVAARHSRIIRSLETRALQLQR